MGLSFAGGDGHVVLAVVVAIEKKKVSWALFCSSWFILVVALVLFIIIITSKIAKNKKG